VSSTSAPAVASRYTIRASSSEDEPFEIALKVEGMMCDGCATSVTEALTGSLDAVKDVKVDLEGKKVSVFVACETMMDGLAMMPALVEAVQEAGFEAEPDF
jgi:copper chaperone CopZ|tara:strand:+ start:5149 stop:5451 length:303 start_codon:yes stop_codon:yes gene_type:complete